MNDNGDIPAERTDPFAEGLAAHRDALPRDGCPYPSSHVEARRWCAGWDHAAFKQDGVSVVIGRIGEVAEASSDT